MKDKMSIEQAMMGLTILKSDHQGNDIYGFEIYKNLVLLYRSSFDELVSTQLYDLLFPSKQAQKRLSELGIEYKN